MFTLYKSEERTVVSGLSGLSSDIFFSSDNEKYLRFGNLVQVTHSILNSGSGNHGMKLHRNMELVDIILSGEVGFQDSFGGTSTFPEGTLQVISSGKGLYQQEFNAGETTAEKLQLGFLPNTLNGAAIKTKGIFDLERNRNAFVELVSPDNTASLTVRQQAAVLMGAFDEGRHMGYSVNDNSVGLFVYIVSGALSVHNQMLRQGDSAGIIEEEQTLLHTTENSKVLLIEVSLNN